MDELRHPRTEPKWSLTTTPIPILRDFVQTDTSQLILTQGTQGGCHLTFGLGALAIDSRLCRFMNSFSHHRKMSDSHLKRKKLIPNLLYLAPKILIFKMVTCMSTCILKRVGNYAKKWINFLYCAT